MVDYELLDGRCSTGGNGLSPIIIALIAAGGVIVVVLLGNYGLS
jgi:hypothetical protein